eukprot:1170448-Heterocapsa_arctica.AAC.1
MSHGAASVNLGFLLGVTDEQGIASALTGTGVHILGQKGSCTASPPRGTVCTGSSTNTTVRVPIPMKVTGSKRE